MNKEYYQARNKLSEDHHGHISNKNLDQIQELLDENNVLVTLQATSYFGGQCTIEFSETGYTVLEDTRKANDGYLHLISDSPESITIACRSQLIKYFFNHPKELPGLGGTPQRRYFQNIKDINEFESIGNNGKKGVYC